DAERPGDAALQFRPLPGGVEVRTEDPPPRDCPAARTPAPRREAPRSPPRLRRGRSGRTVGSGPGRRRGRQREAEQQRRQDAGAQRRLRQGHVDGADAEPHGNHQYAGTQEEHVISAPAPRKNMTEPLRVVPNTAPSASRIRPTPMATSTTSTGRSSPAIAASTIGGLPYGARTGVGK